MTAREELARLGDGAALVTRPQGPLSFIKTTPRTGGGEWGEISTAGGFLPAYLSA